MSSSRLYVWQPDEKTFCPKCNGKVILLTPRRFARMPMFYICWDCKLIAEVGSGVVPEAQD